MSAKAVVVWNQNNQPVINAECTFVTALGGEVKFPLTNKDGYTDPPPALPAQSGYLRVLATGYAPTVAPITLDENNQEIHLGDPGGPPNTIHLPALSFRQSALPAVPVNYPFTGALNIPDVSNAYPFGRIWGPAFGCFDRGIQGQFLDQYQKRNYKWCFYQLSGWPYRQNYPYLDLNVNRIVSDLTYIRSRGFGTIVNFRDDVGPDCSYLKPVAAATQNLVDCCMGIFESNGVFQGDEDLVLDVLQQQRDLWPKAINAFHSTCQNNELPGFGEKSFWEKACKFVDVYFLQQDAWDYPQESVANRAEDFVSRLQGGIAGWPILKYGVILAEETTTATYHLDWTEQMAINKMMWLLDHINPRPKGFLDGGNA